MSGNDATIRRARFADLDNRVLHDLLQLRSAVFVVEQDCVFLDIDGRDHEPGTEHFWVADDEGTVATLRVLHEDGQVWSLGRVVTRVDARRGGVASALVRCALNRLAELGAREVRIGAQAHLADWYRQLGFAESGDAYLEDGIPHVPMTRTVGPG